MGKIGFADVNNTSATQAEFPLGSVYEEKDVKYVYCQANGSIAQYSLVTFDKDFQAVEGTTTTSGARPTRCGVAQQAFADDEYGWIPVRFTADKGFKVNLAANCAANVKLYTTATDGVVDDASSSVDLIQGLVATEAVTTAAAAACEAITELTTNCQD